MALRLLPALVPRIPLYAARPPVATSLARASFRGPVPRPRSTAPVLLMSTSTTPRLPLRYEMWDAFRAFMRRQRIVAAVSALVGMGVVVGYVWWNRSPTAVSYNTLRIFESGGKPGWDAKFEDDASANIPRPDVEKKLEEYIFGSGNASYVLVMGEHGTGKSTAVRRVVRNRKGTNGAVYVNVPPKVPLFGAILAAAVGVPEVIVDLEAGIVRRLNQETKEEREVPMSEEPSVSWGKARLAIEKVAPSFRKKYGRPMVLIIDSAERLAKQNPAFLAELQAYAKDDTDEGNLRMVFVSSDGSVLAQLNSHSASSRGRMPFEVGDIVDAEAVKYLVGKDVKKEQAEEAVRDITGGRFALLRSYVSDWAAKGNEATRADLFRETRKSLRLAGIDPRHEFFQVLLSQKSIDDDPARDMWGEKHVEILDTLLSKNIVAGHPNSTYTFHSRHVESFFKAMLPDGRGNGAIQNEEAAAED
jgi:hypothetical protein